MLLAVANNAQCSDPQRSAGDQRLVSTICQHQVQEVIASTNLVRTANELLAAAAVEGDEEIVGVGEQFFIDISAGEFH